MQVQLRERQVLHKFRNGNVGDKRTLLEQHCLQMGATVQMGERLGGQICAAGEVDVLQ